MEFKGKTVEEAVKSALEELKITEDQAEIKILEEPTKGLFGRIKGQAVIDVEVKRTGITKAAAFVDKVLELLDLTAKTQVVEPEDGNPTINVIAEKSSAVIGFRGELLDALQTLAGAIANKDNEKYKKVVVNCENYRERREETLIALAHRLEGKAADMRREVILEPMNPFERRIIHTALAESTVVTTRSEGKEPERYVVIVPNDKDEFSRPYNAGRNNNNGGRRDGRRDFNRNGNGRKDFGHHGRGDRRERRGGSGFSEEKRKKPSGFGTYLGNSFKDSEN